MSGYLTQELRARGTAQVIVVLRAATGTGAAASVKEGRRLAGHFSSDPVGSTRALAASLRTQAPPCRFFPHLGVLLGTVDRDGLAALRQDPQVVSVGGAPALSPIRPPRVVAARLDRERTWGIERLGVPALWEKGLTGTGVLVAHLDTGVDGKHPALDGAVAHFAEFDEMGRAVQPVPKPHDTDEHGTHTAATIAGRPVRGRHVGVAPGARLASAIVIEGGDAVARVLAGMDWALGLGARVLSLSLGFRGWWTDFLAVTKILRRKGVLPVFAVGNEYAGRSRSPGNYREALSVGACGEDDKVPGFSSSERFARKWDPVVPDLVAPGVAVVSAKPGGGWQEMDGTSMATPHVAGLAALLLQAQPKITVTRLEKAILQSCARPRGMTADRGGHGIPSAEKALLALSGKPAKPAARVVRPRRKP
jgi:subtilisin family serine protease